MENHRLCVKHSWVHLLCTEPLVPRLVRTVEPAEDRYLQLNKFPFIHLDAIRENMQMGTREEFLVESTRGFHGVNGYLTVLLLGRPK